MKNKFTFNKDVAVLMANKEKLERVLVTNTLKLNNYTPRNRNLEGQDYLVVPVTMIVEGVLNGIRYTKDQMFSSESHWNGVPLLLNHPEDGFSANRPELINDYGIGRVYSTRFDVTEDNRGILIAEAYFNISRLQRNAPEVYDKLMNKENIEVSTGLVIDITSAEESYYRGDRFEYVAGNYKPDHLAILPEDIGACNLTDGCGIRENVQNNQEAEASDYKENEMELQEMINKLMEVSTLNKEELEALSECSIKALYKEEIEEKEEVTEEVVEEVTEEVVVEAAEVEEVVAEEVVAENTEEVVEAEKEIEAEEEVTEEVAEIEVEVTEGEEEVVVAPEVVENKVSMVINTKDELFSKIEINSDLMAEIKAGLAMRDELKVNSINAILEANSSAYTKEELTAKNMDELAKLSKFALGANYSITGAVQENAKAVTVEALARPKF